VPEEVAVGLRVLVAFAVGFTETFDVGLAVGLAVAFGVALTVLFAVGAGVAFFVAATAELPERAIAIASMSESFFIRDPT
jgi:hypothetical protein